MDNAGSILFGWVLVLGGMGAYAVRVLARGRALARRLPDEDRPWT